MSNTVFVVKNQHNLYLSKQQEWVDGADNQGLYRTRHRDEAINTVFEVSSRDIYLRAETVACELDAKGNPALATIQPLSAAVLPAEEFDADAEPADVEESGAEKKGAEAALPPEPEAAPETAENIET